MLLGAAFAFGYNEQEMPGEVCFEVFPQPDMSNLDEQILYKTRFIFLWDENMPVDVKTLTLGYQNTVFLNSYCWPAHTSIAFENETFL